MTASPEPGALPTFLVIGAQKSGTTSLIHYLAGHPEVFAPTEEIHYFDWNHDRGADWYRAHFTEAAGQRAVGEGSPEYMYWKGAPERMAHDLPDLRLIAILRDPVDRAYSHYWHNRTRGAEPLGFADAVAAEPERLAGPDRHRAAQYAYMDRGRYMSQLRTVCQHFPRSALRVVIFENLRDDRTRVVQDLYRFLGVDDTVVPPNIAVVKNRFVEYRSQRLRAPIRRFPRPAQLVASRLNIKYAKYPALELDLRERLRSQLEGEIRDLSTWLDRSLEVWDGPPPASPLGARAPA